MKRQGTRTAEEIRAEYRDILERMACWSYQKLREKTDLLLKKAGLIQVDETAGSIDVCKRLALLLEEKGFQKLSLIHILGKSPHMGLILKGPIRKNLPL